MKIFLKMCVAANLTLIVFCNSSAAGGAGLNEENQNSKTIPHKKQTVSNNCASQADKNFLKGQMRESYIKECMMMDKNVYPVKEKK